jgi:hypothetical protein
MGLAVASQWLWTFVMILITPVGISNIGWKLYLIFAIFNACFVPLTYLFVPETAGFSLEAVDFYFMDRTTDPIKGANAMWKAMKEGRDFTVSQDEKIMEDEKKEVIVEKEDATA